MISLSAHLRQGIERLSRGRSFRRRLPPGFGCRTLWVSADARLRFLKPGVAAFDSELLSYVNDYVQVGDVVWDVGANVGEFAFAAADRVGSGGRVLAIEPDPELAGLMSRSLAEPCNTDLNLRVLCAAVADRLGVAEFRIAQRGRAANSLAEAEASTQAGGTREKILVPMVSLDKILESESAPGLVKIDVEGAELLVLQGAARLLQDIRPKIIIEVSQQKEAVLQILKHAGYQLFDAARGEKGGEIYTCSFNTLALPRVRTD